MEPQKYNVWTFESWLDNPNENNQAIVARNQPYVLVRILRALIGWQTAIYLSEIYMSINQTTVGFWNRTFYAFSLNKLLNKVWGTKRLRQ